MDLLHCTSQLLALSGGSQGGEFTSAFRGAAEVHGRTASAAFEAYDPQLPIGGLLLRCEAHCHPRCARVMSSTQALPSRKPERWTSSQRLSSFLQTH